MFCTEIEIDIGYWLTKKKQQIIVLIVYDILLSNSMDLHQIYLMYFASEVKAKYSGNQKSK